MSSRSIRGPFKFDSYYTITTGDYTVVNESIIFVNKTVGAATAVPLPAAGGASGSRRVVMVVDKKGDAATNNITVSVVGSGTINNASTYVMAENYICAAFIDNGTQWDLLFVSLGVSAVELAYINGITTLGTTQASKAWTADSSNVTAITGRTTTTDGVASGTARVVGGLAYNSTAASTAVASTSVETLFSTSYSVPADTLKAGSLVKIRFQGIATTSVGSDTMAIKLYIGGTSGTALISAAAVDIANSDVFTGEFELVCRTAGATGTMVGVGTYKTTAAEGTATIKDDILASTTINTQAAQVIGVSVTFNNTNANSARLDVLRVEIY